MIIDEFLLQLNEFDTLKISLWDEFIKDQWVYHAKYVNVNIDFYKDLSDFEQKNSFGIDYCEENNGPIIYYYDKAKFVNDIKIAMTSGHRLKNQLK